MHVPYGACWVSRDDGSGGVVAASVWAPPGKAPGLWTYLRQGLLATPFKFGLCSVRRMMAVDGAVSKIKKELRFEATWYLDTIGVDPTVQGRGLGSKMLRQILDEVVDPSGVPATLYTTRPQNVPFYERFGFAVERHETMSGGDGFEMWFMRRER